MLVEIKNFALLLRFFKELVYDKPEEGSFKSATFSPRKFTVVLIFMLLMSTTSLLFNRSKALALRVIDLETRLSKYEVTTKKVVDKAVEKAVDKALEKIESAVERKNGQDSSSDAPKGNK